MKTLHKITLAAMIGMGMLFPLISHAVTAVPWTTPNTSAGYITPSLVNGVFQRIGLNTGATAYLEYSAPLLNIVTPNMISLVTAAGAPSLTLDPTEGIYIPNNQGYSAKDTGGTTRNLVKLNSSNALLIGDSAIGTTKFPALSTDGFVKTSGGDGTLSIDTTSYLTTAVTNVATNNGLTGGPITTTGTIGLNTTGLSVNAPITWNGSNLAATGTPQFTAGNYLATSTSANNVFLGNVGVNITSPTARLHVVGANNPNLFGAAENFFTATGGAGFNSTSGTAGKGGSSMIRAGSGGTTVSGTGGAGGDIILMGGANGGCDSGSCNKAGDVMILAGQSDSTTYSTNGKVGIVGIRGDIVQFSSVPSFGGATTTPALINNNGYYGHSTSTPWGRISIGSHNGATTIPSFVIASSSTGLATTTQFIVTNGRVGIATSSPYAALSVVGEAVSRNFTATSTTLASTFPYASSTSFSTSGRLYSGDNFYVGSSGSTGKTISMFASGGTEVTASADTYFGFPVLSTTMIKNTQGRFLFDPLDSKAEFVVSGATTQFNIYNSSLAQYYLRVSSDGSNITSTQLFGNVGVATDTPASLLSVGSSGTATSTLFMDSGTGKGSCIVMKDSDGSGFTYITANNGVLSASTVSCK